MKIISGKEKKIKERKQTKRMNYDLPDKTTHIDFNIFIKKAHRNSRWVMIYTDENHFYYVKR
ncbi:MAG: hypothetical protein WC644_02730 [Ignavibacteria bacterium]